MLYVFAMRTDNLRDFVRQGWTSNAWGHMVSPDGKQYLRINYEHDYAFEIYADLCMQNPDNPYFQNIYDHWMMSDGSHVTWCERLVNLPPSGIKKKGLGFYLRKSFEPYCLYQFFSDENYNHQLEMHFLSDEQLVSALRILYQTIDALFDSDHPISCGLDLHTGNIMVRPDKLQSHCVLSDPFEPCFQDYDRQTKEFFPSCPLDNFSVRDLMLRRKIGLMDPPYLKALRVHYRNGDFTWEL